MKFILSLSSFALTMILGLIAFTYTAINFPSTMRDLLAGAQHVRDQVQQLALPDSYMVWVDIFLQPNQIVLVGFSIAMRVVIGIVGSIFGRGRATSSGPAPTAAGDSPFGRWG
jgi:hypothetical protein